MKDKIDTVIGIVDYWEYVIACCLEFHLYQSGKLLKSEVNKTLLFDFYMNEIWDEIFQ